MVLVQFCLYLNAIFSVERPGGYNNTSFFIMPNDIKKFSTYLRKQEVADWTHKTINSFQELEKYDREIFVALWIASQVYPQSR